MKDLLRKLLWKCLTLDERYILLRRKAQKAHKRQAEIENHVGHTNECCDKDLM